MTNKVQKLRLNTLTNTRKSLSKLIREYHASNGENTTYYRCLTYMIKTLLESFENDRKYELEDRIRAIEEKIGGLG